MWYFLCISFTFSSFWLLTANGNWHRYVIWRCCQLLGFCLLSLFSIFKCLPRFQCLIWLRAFCAFCSFLQYQTYYIVFAIIITDVILALWVIESWGFVIFKWLLLLKGAFLMGSFLVFFTSVLLIINNSLFFFFTTYIFYIPTLIFRFFSISAGKIP